MKLKLAVLVMLLCLVPVSLHAKHPENRVPVSEAHYDHDLHQHSPFFDIDLDCKTIRWTVEEEENEKAHFDVRDRLGMRIDKTILSDLTDGSVTPRPESKKTLYVSNVRKAKGNFTVSASCVD